ncbi:hypothetical protein [Spiroplasma endosymbiont of Seladonia tumulorum]|uniref:hypothetical protein n=1 Tax=Spiroplasma endosymbiont of Seladonia tumulorum TaxID=3066321 RepID=UPI0030D48B3A
MKKLLTLFSAFVLGSGSVFTVASCRTRPKHNIDDEEVNDNKDIEILNQIKVKVRQTLTALWDTKTTIDINDYSDQEKLRNRTHWWNFYSHFFNKRTSDLQGTLKGADVVSNNLKYKVNYTKNEKSLTIKLLHKGWVYSYNDISLSYFTFMNNEFNFYYSFFINVMWKDINVDNNKYSFLQIIEFQVI